MKKSRSLPTVIIIIIIVYIAQSMLMGAQKIRFRHVSLEQGLSQSMVFCILQDSSGFMWFGTQDGLNKYDGYEFQVYRPDPENPRSISNNNISTLFEDSKGQLWIGTNGGGLNRFNREMEEFVHYRNNPDDAASISNDSVLVIFEDNNGNLWVGTQDGLNKYNPDTDSFTIYRNNPDDPASLSSNGVLSIFQDRGGTLWFGTFDGLNKFNPQGTFTRYQTQLGYLNGLISGVIISVFEDHSGEFWVGTGAGLHRMNRETGEFRAYLHNPGTPGSLSHNTIRTIYEDHAGVLWLATMGGGLNVFDRRREQFRHYRHDPNDPDSLGSDYILSFYEDRSGVLWIGSDSGISRFERQTEKFQRYTSEPDNPNSISSGFIFAICEDHEGNLWLGTNGQGVDCYDRTTGEIVRYRAESGNPGSLSLDYVYSIFEDSKNRLWVGTNGGGLNRFHRDTGAFSIYTVDLLDPNSLSSSIVKVIAEDAHGTLWLGTLGGGLNKFDPETEKVKRYLHDPDNPGSIGHNDIRGLLITDSGSIWVGTAGAGLNLFDPETETFTRFRSDLNVPTSISADIVQSLYLDNNGILWVGTFGGGLNRFDPETGVFTHFREKDGLPNEVVYGILPDEDGYLWLSTNKGLSRFDPRTRMFRNYTPRDGLQSNEFNGGSYFKSISGELFFGGVNGFNSFHPSEIKRNVYVPPIVITGFQVFNKPVGIGGDSPLRKHISHTREIVLSHSQNVFSFNFVALDYTIPEKNQYQYKMDGFNDDWIVTGASRRFASYTNLGAGTYVFRVKGSNNDGIWNNEGAAIKIIITPPFWQTWWFRLLVFILVVLASFLFYRMRMRSIYQKMRLETELCAARAAQMSIMPQDDPRLPGFEVSGICVPAHEVGGDFFDYLWLDEQQARFGIAIGDVSGKAMKAAMTAVMSSGMLYSKVNCAGNIKDIMTEMNKPLFRKTDKRMFTALCLASLDVYSKEFIFSNAGLSEPLLKTRESVSFVEGMGSRLPLGSFPSSQYQETALRLNPGDVVVLFTDGIAEAQNTAGEFYGYRTLKELVAVMETSGMSAADIKFSIIDAVKQFSGSAPQHDDMTVVVIKIRES